MDWQVETFLKNLFDGVKQEYAFRAKTKEQWQEWQTDLSEIFSRQLGLAGLPLPEGPIAARLLEKVSCNGYSRSRLGLQLAADLEVPVYVLEPDQIKKPLAAIIACHGHGYGSRDLVGLTAEGQPKTGEAGYQENFALELVQRGFLVIVPDLFGFGDLRLAEDKAKGDPRASSCYRISADLLQVGHSLAGLRVWQIQRILDWLGQLEEIRQDKIACMGISGGGLVCSFSAALDTRIRAAVVSGYTNTFRGSIMAMHHCIDNFTPGLLPYAEMPDLIGLIAPRPLFVESGSEDPIFPEAATREAIRQLEGIYQLLGQEDKFAWEIFPAAHQIWGEKAYAWLEDWQKAAD